MEEMFANGRIVDIVIAFMAAEAIGLLVFRRTLAAGLGVLDVLALLLPGLCLLLAMRAGLTGAGWHAVALWLVAALVAHVADLSRRLRRF